MTTPTAPLFTAPVVDAFGGTPLVALPGAKLYFTLAGGTTPTTVWTDGALTVPAASPVVADATGQFIPVYLNPNVPLRVRMTKADGTLVYQVDPYNPSQTAALIYPATATEVAAGAVILNGVYRPGDPRRYGYFEGNTDAGAWILYAASKAGFVALYDIQYLAYDQDIVLTVPLLFITGTLKIDGVLALNVKPPGCIIGATRDSITIHGGGTLTNVLEVPTNHGDRIEVGADARTGYQSSIAVGLTARALATKAVALGRAAVSEGSNSIAIGTTAIGYSASSVVIGSNAQGGVNTFNTTTTTASAAIGDSAIKVAALGTIGGGSVVLIETVDGSLYTGTVLNTSAGPPISITLTAALPIAVNNGAVVRTATTGNVAIGAGSYAGRDNSVAIGPGAAAFVAATGNAVAIGYNSAASAYECIAIGYASSALNTGAIAIGQSAVADVSSSQAVVIGSGAQATSATYGIAIGYGAQALYQDQIALGRPTHGELKLAFVEAEPADAHLENGTLTLWVDSTNHRLMFKVKEAGGTVKKSVAGTAGSYLALQT
jgi:hypothetical protein